MHIQCEMIATIKLTHSSPGSYRILHVRTLEVYLLSKLQVYSTSLLAAATTLGIKSSDLHVLIL